MSEPTVVTERDAFLATAADAPDDVRIPVEVTVEVPDPFDAYVFVEEDNQLKPARFGEGPLYAFTRDYNLSMLYYNRDHFDALGLDYPDETWTWDDLAAVAQKLTIDFDKDGVTDQWGFVGLDYGHLAGIIGGRKWDASERRSNFSSPEVVAAVRFCQDLIYKYRAHPPVTLRLEDTGPFSSSKTATSRAIRSP